MWQCKSSGDYHTYMTAIDAICYSGDTAQQYQDPDILRDLNKAFVGFYQPLGQVQVCFSLNYYLPSKNCLVCFQFIKFCFNAADRLSACRSFTCLKSNCIIKWQVKIIIIIIVIIGHFFIKSCLLGWQIINSGSVV